MPFDPSSLLGPSSSPTNQVSPSSASSTSRCRQTRQLLPSSEQKPQHTTLSSSNRHHNGPQLGSIPPSDTPDRAHATLISLAVLRAAPHRHCNARSLIYKKKAKRSAEDKIGNKTQANNGVCNSWLVQLTRVGAEQRRNEAALAAWSFGDARCVPGATISPRRGVSLVPLYPDPWDAHIRLVYFARPQGRETRRASENCWLGCRIGGELSKPGWRGSSITKYLPSATIGRHRPPYNSQFFPSSHLEDSPYTWIPPILFSDLLRSHHTPWSKHTMSAKNSPRFAASSLPHADAPVDEVRAYISLLLHTKLQVPAAEADTIAQRWQHGRGYELRRLPRETFAGVFGEEVGAILHLHIQDTIRRGKRAEMDSYLPISMSHQSCLFCSGVV